jgi:predicted transcriptional regulator
MSEASDHKNLPHGDLLRMTTEVVAAYLGNNTVGADQIPDVINTVFGSLRDVGGATTETKSEPLKPAVSVRKSVMPDYIVCLEDGKKLKMLKRHLRTMYNMSPEDYRQKWNLPADYPMVAPNYAKQRSDFAKQIGLGRAAPKAETKPARRGGKRS